MHTRTYINTYINTYIITYIITYIVTYIHDSFSTAHIDVHTSFEVFPINDHLCH
jgi:hypothetical protein